MANCSDTYGNISLNGADPLEHPLMGKSVGNVRFSVRVCIRETRLKSCNLQYARINFNTQGKLSK